MERSSGDGEENRTQYVHDDNGEIVRGNWWMPRDLPDEPLIVTAQEDRLRFRDLICRT